MLNNRIKEIENLFIAIVLIAFLIAISVSFANCQSRYKTPYQTKVSKMFTKKHYNKKIKYYKQGYLKHGAMKRETRIKLISGHRRTGTLH